MTTREQDAFKLAFDRVTAIANRRPLPQIPGWAAADIDSGQINESWDASTGPAEHGAAASAVGLTALPAPKRSGRPQWVAAAAVALVLMLSVVGLVARFAPNNSVADTPTPNVSQSPSAKPSSSPTTAKTLPSEQSPCFNMPAFRESGALPSDVNRIWVCGEGYDAKPLEGEAAAALMAKINAVPSPTASDDGIGTCHEPDAKSIQVFFDSAGQHHGNIVKGTSCGLLGGVSAKAAVPLIMDAMKSAHGAPAAQAGTADDLCAMTNLRYGWFDRAKPVTKAAVCTDQGSVPLEGGRNIADPALSQVVRQTLQSNGCVSHLDFDPEAAPTVNEATPGIAFRVTNGDQVAVWYLVGRWVLMSPDGQSPCMWAADATTEKQLRDLATPQQPKATYKTAKSESVPLSTSPCVASPALDNGRDFPQTTDRIWLCASGWDTRPLVGAEAAAVLERIKAKKLAKEPGDGECADTSDAKVPVFFDSGSERVGYYLSPFCQPVNLVPTQVIYDEITNALMATNGPPNMPNLVSDLCASTDVPTGGVDGIPTLPMFVSKAAVCTDATGKPLAQGRPLSVDEEAWLNFTSNQEPTSGPEHPAWITVRISDGHRIETMYLVGDQLWGGGGILAVNPDAKTLAEIRKLAGQ